MTNTAVVKWGNAMIGGKRAINEVVTHMEEVIRWRKGSGKVKKRWKLKERWRWMEEGVKKVEEGG